jgi:hypothetical protein
MGYNPQTITIHGVLKMKVAKAVNRKGYFVVVKIALVFIALFSGSAMAQYTGQRSSFVDWQCKYE